MALLPSGYKVCNSLGGVYDSGILAQSGLEIDALFYFTNLQGGSIFGARNTNSTTSNGQLYLSTDYFGYNNNQAGLSPVLRGKTGYVHFYVSDNYAEVNDNESITSVSRTSATFTGARTMYIGNMNNAGSQGTASNGYVLGFIIKKDGIKLADLVPCMRESDSAYGLYDIVSDSFLSPLNTYSPTMYSCSIQQTDGGKAYFKTYHGELVEELMENSPIIAYQEYVANVRAIAYPEPGYTFEGWEINGSIVSQEEIYDLSVRANTVLIPQFKKIIDVDFNQNCIARVLQYGTGTHTDLTVRSASISESGLEKVSSQFVCESIPSTVVQGCPIRLFSPKGKLMYSGMVEAIEDDAITCREILAFYDLNFLFKSGIVDSNKNVIYGIKYLMAVGTGTRDFVNADTLYSRYTNFIYSQTNRLRFVRMSLYYDQICHTPFPTISETATENFEDFIQSFASCGIFMGAKWQRDTLQFDPYYFRNSDTLKLGDNMENISNIQIIEESQEGTIVQIYSSSGTLRGMYGVTIDGTIARYDSGSVPASDFVGYSNYIGDIVLSDDPISTITAEKLSSSYLNHKITFDVMFSDMLTFDQLKVGTPVDFYVGSRLFHSVITAVDYEIHQNTEVISNAQITLGNVRTSLTSKLNKRK